jgi:hypothetical protein
MIAMLVGTIGLIGTMAVQQSILGASKNANDAAIAMRLATQKLEELSGRSTDTQQADSAIGLAPLVTSPPAWRPLNASLSSVPEYVDVQGNSYRDSGGNPIPPTDALKSNYRWQRQWKVVNTGADLPYVISVIVTYSNDLGTPRTTRLDLERRKSW